MIKKKRAALAQRYTCLRSALAVRQGEEKWLRMELAQNFENLQTRKRYGLHKAVIFLITVLAGAGTLGLGSASQLPPKPVVDIPLPGGATRIDYQSLDASRHLLFIAHLGDSAVIVVNTRTRHIVGVVRDISAVHGVLAIPQLDAVYASATGENEVVAIDESTLRIKARIPGGIYPDGLAFDPSDNRIFVSDEHGGTDTVISARTNRRVATIRIGGQIGNTQYDPVSRNIFVNAEGLGKLVEIDPQTNSVVRRTELPGCLGNHGLLIDARNRRAFVACEDNAAFLWIDMRTMSIRGRWIVGPSPDVLAVDPVLGRLYVAAESGVVAVFSVNSNVRRIAQGFFAPDAHSVAVDPMTQLVFFPLEDISGRPVLRVLKELRMPTATSSEVR
jgi:DNA-binding beta-propeller fold protein YncE